LPTSLLSKILAPQALSTVLQPIYKVGEGDFAPVILECLTRGPAHTNAAHAGVLFQYAQLKAAEAAVDRACITTALRAIAAIPLTMRISLNVFAATLVRDSSFVHWIDAETRRLKLDPSHLIFEIVESGEAWNAAAFKKSVDEMRGLGAAIALDDVGLAHSNLQRILECDPDFLKLDQCIVRACHQDPRRRVLLKSLSMLAHDLGMTLIAEGVETREELGTLLEHEIDFFQGYLFSPPLPPAEIGGRLRAPALVGPIHGFASSVKMRQQAAAAAPSPGSGVAPELANRKSVGK
jgi:EAL domain-containing protein (putative c-di-GMP-specific phosphodiesterase class I)